MAGILQRDSPPSRVATSWRNESDCKRRWRFPGTRLSRNTDNPGHIRSHPHGRAGGMCFALAGQMAHCAGFAVLGSPGKAPTSSPWHLDGCERTKTPAGSAGAAPRHAAFRHRYFPVRQGSAAFRTAQIESDHFPGCGSFDRRARSILYWLRYRLRWRRGSNPGSPRLRCPIVEAAGIFVTHRSHHGDNQCNQASRTHKPGHDGDDNHTIRLHSKPDTMNGIGAFAVGGRRSCPVSGQSCRKIGRCSAVGHRTVGWRPRGMSYQLLVRRPTTSRATQAQQDECGDGPRPLPERLLACC